MLELVLRVYSKKKLSFIFVVQIKIKFYTRDLKTQPIMYCFY